VWPLSQLWGVSGSLCLLLKVLCCCICTWLLYRLALVRVQDPKVREHNWVIRPVNPGPMSLLEGKHLLDDGV
jgi:hypothetical protein